MIILKLFVLLTTCLCFNGCGGPSGGTRGDDPDPPTIDPFTLDRQALDRQAIGKYNVKFRGINVNVFDVLDMGPPKKTEASWSIRKSLNGNCLRIEGLFTHKKGRVFLTGVAVARDFTPDPTCGEWESGNVNLLARTDFGGLYEMYEQHCESRRCVAQLFLSDFTQYHHLIYQGEYEMKFIVSSRKILS
jgi:hypothetical protein